METPVKKKNEVVGSPWFSVDERNAVLQKLYSNNLDEQAEALRYIDVWKSRIYPNVPSGIEVTSALAKAILLHENFKLNPSDNLDDDHFLLLYGTAIIRFVNLVTECGQVTDYQIPIHTIAYKMGIPEWIVDLRHSATHSRLPSLEVLSVAARWAFNWLKSKYWDSETTISSNFYPTKAPTPVKVQYKDLTIALLEIHEVLKKIVGHRKLEGYSKMKNDAMNRIKTLAETSESYELVGALLSDGLMFLSAQEVLKSSLKLREKAFKNRLRSWLQVIRRLPTEKCLILLLKELFVIAAGDGRRNEPAAQWISTILKWIKGKHNHQTTYNDNLQFCQFVLMTATPLTVDCVKPVLEIFAKHLSSNALNQLTSLAKTAAPQIKHFALLNELESSIDDSTESLMETDEEVTSEWSLCHVGVIPSQLASDYLDLRLPDVMNFAASKQFKIQPSFRELKAEPSRTDAKVDESKLVELALL
ncbi:hypothetical protein CHUAL_007522 [Chamberlinius hualienensis]